MPYPTSEPLDFKLLVKKPFAVSYYRAIKLLKVAALIKGLELDLNKLQLFDKETEQSLLWKEW